MPTRVSGSTVLAAMANGAPTPRHPNGPGSRSPPGARCSEPLGCRRHDVPAISRQRWRPPRRSLRPHGQTAPDEWVRHRTSKPRRRSPALPPPLRRSPSSQSRSSMRAKSGVTATSWLTTVPGSAATPTSASLFHPIFDGSASIWITVASGFTFLPKPVRKSQSTPRARTTSAPRSALPLARFPRYGWPKGSEPRASELRKTGARSALANSSSVSVNLSCLVHLRPVPPNTTGWLAPAQVPGNLFDCLGRCARGSVCAVLVRPGDRRLLHHFARHIPRYVEKDRASAIRKSVARRHSKIFREPASV